MGLATVFVTAGNGTLTADIADEIQLLTRSWGQRDTLAELITGVKVPAGVPGLSAAVRMWRSAVSITPNAWS